MASSKIPTPSPHPKFTIINAPTRPPTVSSPTIFLSGSIEGGPAPDWRSTLSSSLSHLPVTILNPVRKDWDSSWVEDISCVKFKEQVEWELDYLEKANLVAVYFGPQSLAPLTLMELGLRVRTGKVIVACPEGYWKRGNVQVACARWGLKLVGNEEELRGAVVESLKELGVVEGEKWE